MGQSASSKPLLKINVKKVWRLLESIGERKVKQVER